VTNRQTNEGATGFDQSAAPSIRTQAFERAKRLIAWSAQRLQPWTARSAQRLQLWTARSAQQLQPWIALLKDVAAVIAVLATPVVSKAVDLGKKLVTKVIDRFGMRVTVMGAATAIFIGSTGSAAMAITSLDTEPAMGPNGDVVAAETALSEESAAAAATSIADDQRAAAAAAAEAAAKKAAEEAAKKAAEPKPVGGLSKTQMANAVAIIEAGKDEGLDKKAWAIALSTAMQESKFRNYANVNVPESYDYDYQAEGSDHDSVGLFQQRLSWGDVEDLMTPKKSASKFYKALERVDGWEDMPVTEAAQTVQVSAFPDAYAQWEDLAWDIIDEYNAS
jgi:hypothetical protein